VVGGLLLSPRPGPAEAPGADPSSPSADGPSAGAAGGLSPRAGHGDQAADPAVPSPEAAAGGLPSDMSLAELFPAEAALEGASPDDASGTPADLTQGGEIALPGSGSDHVHRDRAPLIAGLIATLLTLFGGGGFLWWRNRDANFWPA
jgi:hypothetical protein